MLFLIIRILRALGLFPYQLSSQPAAATFNVSLLVYSLIPIMALWGSFIATKLVLLPKTFLWLSGTKYVIFLMMNITLFVSIIFTPLYFLLCSSRLAKALVSLLDFHNKQLCRFTQSTVDKHAIIQVFYVLVSMINVYMLTINTSYSWYLKAFYCYMLCHTVLMRFIVPMFHNALFRLLSLMLAAAFTPLEKFYEKLIPGGLTPVEVLSWAEKRTASGQRCYKNNHERKTKIAENTCVESKCLNDFGEFFSIPTKMIWGTWTPSLHQQEVDALLFARCSVTVIAKIEATITSLFTPVICVQLLLECILIIIITMSTNADNFSEFFTNIFVLSHEAILTYLLLDATEYYKKKVRETLRLG